MMKILERRIYRNERQGNIFSSFYFSDNKSYSWATPSESNPHEFLYYATLYNLTQCIIRRHIKIYTI